MIRMVVVDQLVENVPNVLVGAVEELVLETPFGPALIPAKKTSHVGHKITTSTTVTSHKEGHGGHEGHNRSLQAPVVQNLAMWVSILITITKTVCFNKAFFGNEPHVNTFSGDK